MLCSIGVSDPDGAFIVEQMIPAFRLNRVLEQALLIPP